MKDQKKVKRIGAWIGLILIALMLVITFISAIFAKEHTSGLFMASIFSIIVVPMMYYMFVAVYKFVHRNDNPDTDVKLKK